MMNSKQYETPLISVLTPTWNRASYLERVWNGLNNQSYRNFEWVVADDGSTDDTNAVIHDLAKKSDFPIILISANIRVGKACMDNQGIKVANGEFILWCDSDDYLVSNALDKLVETWNSIPVDKRKLYVGVTALCEDSEGITSTELPSAGLFDTTWNELAEVHKVTVDMLNFTKASELKELLFPEVDFLVPEGITWTTLGEQRVRICPEILKINEYGATHCISFSGKMEYSRGRSFAMATSERNLRAYPRPFQFRIWKLITYIRYCIHGELGLLESIQMWGNNSSRLLFLCCLPIARLLAVKDRLQGKVTKTHRQFFKNKRKARIEIVKLNLT